RGFGYAKRMVHVRRVIGRRGMDIGDATPSHALARLGQKADWVEGDRTPLSIADYADFDNRWRGATASTRRVKGAGDEPAAGCPDLSPRQSAHLATRSSPSGTCQRTM